MASTRDEVKTESEARSDRYRERADKRPGIVRVRKLEVFYARQLRKIAHHAGEIIRTWALNRGEEVLEPSAVPGLMDQLAKYAEAITPWAKATAARMLAEIAVKDRRQWGAQAKEMSLALRRELKETPLGAVLRARLAEQVKDITSIPTDAAARVQALTLKGLEDGTRSTEYVAEIMRSGEVAKSRANMLARTMVSTTASDLVEARALNVGSEAYVWETSKDAEVRPSHRKMQGKVIRWDTPPTIDGYTAHAGRFANCRCWPRPIWPDF